MEFSLSTIGPVLPQPFHLPSTSQSVVRLEAPSLHWEGVSDLRGSINTLSWVGS